MKEKQFTLSRCKMTRSTLAERLDELTHPGALFDSEQDGVLRCHACAHRCRLKPGQRGVCQVRFNRAGELHVPWGYVAAAQTDPIEKKPFAHFLPGSDALTFGMLGCNFHCDFCQNWVSSQALREPASERSLHYIDQITPQQLVDFALRSGAQIIASSYNEPLITSEWAAEIFRLGKEKGLKCVYVSNGFATPEVLQYLRPYLDGFKVDLKSMRDETYRSLGGRLQPVLDSIRLAWELGLWVEAVTLVVPGLNDSPDELWEAARFLYSVSPGIPWHVTAFHPDYKLTDRRGTSADSLLQAAEIAQEANLHYVYAGNLPGRVGSLENTFCPGCRTALVLRAGYTIQDYRITADGTCPQCGQKIAGVWTDRPESVRLHGWGFPRRLEW